MLASNAAKQVSFASL